MKEKRGWGKACNRGNRSSSKDLSWNSIKELNEGGFVTLTRLQELNIANNHLEFIPEAAFLKLTTLRTLHLQNNKFRSIPSLSFVPLVNLENLYLSYNNLALPSDDAFASLPRLQKLWLDGTNFFEIPVKSLQTLTKLESLEINGNQLLELPLALSSLPALKELTLSEVRLLDEFPDIRGTASLEHLRIDRANLNVIPADMCSTAPLLRSLNLKSNKLTEVPEIGNCVHLKLIDLESNKIEIIDEEAFVHFKDLRDLVENDRYFTIIRNLGENKFPKLPTKGLQNLRQLKTFNNRELKEFPPVQTFPRISTLALSYAYHCCEFIASSNHKTSGPKSTTSLQETIVWLSKDDVDMSSWNANITDIYPDSSGNFSRKFEEFANKLWKTFGRDYTIPDNLAQYAEEYFEDYKALENIKFALQCLPEPGKF
ncbi:leucine-rich repeat-containing G-protein coupled receptor 5 [Nephila pilipes]|uniref:Leucine-rich repeat-containing G-protein coupled receptor 5 n=1 Tax=Nephila pilipes TaxID=299642 RepID=A0A8X6NQP5_NEPPI|nr:leucine-rich repeat-containing G-protein coupled receptor 5 [Nephila pilipes]